MFKLQNPLVVLDLEATAGQDAQGFQTNDYIIDLGAVYLDEELVSKGSFSHLVRPEQPINEFIQKLTGITPAMVSDEPLFSQVGGDFTAWVASLAGNVKKVRLAAWGNYFDIPLLRKSYQRYGLEFPFSGTAIDIKSLAFLWLSLSGRRTDKVNLPFFAQHFGLVQGQQHRALSDAQLTAEVAQCLWRDLQGVFVPVKEGEPFRLAHLSWEPSNSERS